MPTRKEWFVEVILKARRTDKSLPKARTISTKIRSPAWEYFIKWAGFPEADNSWETVRCIDVKGCAELLTSFWNNVGEESFLIDFPGFVLEPTKDWIRERKIHFAKHVPISEVERQNRNPKRKRSETPPPPSAPSTPRRTSSPQTGSPSKKVAFARIASVNIIPSLIDVENTAQYCRSTKKPTFESSDEDEDDNVPIAISLNTTPTGLKIRLPALKTVPIVLQPPFETLDDRFEPEPMLETPPASPNSLFSDALPSPPNTPPHRSIKFIDQNLDSGSKLTTKQRLAKAMVAPGIPRASPAPSQPTADDTVDMDPTPTLVANESMGAGVADINAMFASFTHDDDPAGAGFYGSDEDRYAGLPKNGDAIDLDGLDGMDEALDEAAPVGEVDDFLNTIELRDSVKSDPDDYRPLKPLNEPAPIEPWTWKGRVTISVADCIETICEKATFVEFTEAEPPHFASFVHSKRDLIFDALFDVDDIVIFLQHCQPPHQFARLTAEGPDAESLCIFSDYMAKKGQAIMIPAMMDGELLGCLLFVPPAAKSLLEYVHVPTELCLEGGLIAVLLFCVGRYPHPSKKRQILLLQNRVEPALLSRNRWHQSLQQEMAYHIGLRIIQLPAYIREYVFKHAAAIWCKCSSADKREDPDTRHLRRVLKRTEAGVVPPADISADVVFVHVGALRNIHNLPHLAERRLSSKLRFCLYGTHETVHPSRWGFREIYLLGGVVTFTAEALVDDAWGVLRIIQNIHAHPLWTCYLIPQVLGMAIKLNQLREDEMPEDTVPYTLDRIFEAICDGQVALMQTPVIDPTDDIIREWVLEHSLFRPLTTQAVLERCTQAFEAAYAPSPQETRATLARNDVLGDIRRMQIQPTVLTAYRRFVVLVSSSDALRYRSPDGIECETLRSFSFNDDFIEAKVNGDL